MLRLIAKSELDAKDKADIMAFGKDKLRGGSGRKHVGTAATLKYVLGLYQAGRWLGKPLHLATLDDLDDLFSKLEHGKIRRRDGQAYRPAGIRDYRLSLKVFYGWANRKDLSSNITTRCAKIVLDPAKLWTEPEMNLLIGAGQDTQDKALIAVLCESAGRIGEIGSMTIGSVKQGIEGIESHEAMIQIDGKTGPRNVLLLWSVPWLQRWLEEHPYKGRSDSPLWIMPRHDEKGRRIWQPRTYSSLAHSLRMAAKQSGINKPCNCHNFRKSMTTVLRRKGYDPELVKRRNGWTRGSNMLQVYEALTDSDVANEERRINGRAMPTTQPHITRSCQSCGTVNLSTALSCTVCGEVIDMAERDRRLMATMMERMLGMLPALLQQQGITYGQARELGKMDKTEAKKRLLELVQSNK